MVDAQQGNKESPLVFDVVIATRNRPEALGLSIPLILSQSRLPERLIVIDSSEDHAPVLAAVRKAVSSGPRKFQGQVIVEQSEAGAALQRNRGLRHVASDIVFFPDDDSLFHPGTSEEIMAVYERDIKRRIAGVCSREAETPPANVLPEKVYKIKRGESQFSVSASLKRMISNRFTSLNPILYIGNIFADRARRSDFDLSWMSAEDCVLVGYMTGFRMTFRTDYIRAAGGLDETLRGYAIVEDTEACFAMSRFGCLVGARKAAIYHHKFPAGRGGGYMLGGKTIANRAYIIAKHIIDGKLSEREARTARRKMRIYCWFKALSGLASCGSSYKRDHLRGVVAAWRGVHVILDSPRSTLAERYRQLMVRIGIPN